MVPSSTSTLAYAGLTGIVLYFIYRWRTSRIPRGLKLPPGPPGRPLIGNLLDFPRSKEWLTFNQWAKEYGDLVYINILGRSMLFVNSPELAKELFDKRGSIYSGRPHSTVLHDLIGAGWSMPILPYGDLWRQTRAYFVQYFNQTAAQNYHEIQTKYTKVLLKRLYQSPDNYRSHIRYIVGATILEIVYGIQASSENDPFITLSEDTTMRIVRAGLPGTYLVDFLPPLKYIPPWLPGAKFRRDLDRLRNQVNEMAERPIAFVKDASKNGTSISCIATSLTEQFENNPDRPANYEDLIKHVTGVAYVSGVDVTDAFIQHFFLAMLLHPHVQDRAQQELDQVIGSGVLPSFDDLERLKYVKALVYEILRWNTIVPGGFPHVVTADDVVNGYFIPKETLVFGNSWTLLRDKAIYGPDADKFNPERFFQDNIPRPEFGFGFGRRVCPGRYVGENIVTIAIACILHLFHILPSQSENGPDLPGEEDYVSGVILGPKPFKCRIIPRSSNAVRLLEELDI